MPTKESKLSLAAGELIRLACAEIESASLEGVADIARDTTALKDTITIIEKQLHAKTDHIVEAINHLNLNVTLSRKIQSLEWALSNSNLASFKYLDTKNNLVESTDLVKFILFSFRKNIGCRVENYTLNGGAEDGQKEFRDKLVNQLFELTGVKPRLVLASDKVKYAIHYQ
jgi:hypothetical protein